MWNLSRIERTAIGLLEARKLSVKPLIWERIPFEQASKAYELISDTPGAKAKILLMYDKGVN
jgi:threonine dehydrogenase-like Zn-dependent dehydrogenase